MPDSYAAIEKRISEAIDTLNQREKPNVAAIACRFNVPAHRLRERWKGRPAKSAPNRALSEAQELALCQHIDRLDKESFKLRHDMLREAANTILPQSHTVLPPLQLWALNGHNASFNVIQSTSNESRNLYPQSVRMLISQLKFRLILMRTRRLRRKMIYWMQTYEILMRLASELE